MPTALLICGPRDGETIPVGEDLPELNFIRVLSGSATVDLARYWSTEPIDPTSLTYVVLRYVRRAVTLLDRSLDVYTLEGATDVEVQDALFRHLASSLAQRLVTEVTQ